MICDILKNLREEKGLSRQQVADMLGISKRTIESYEYGNREPNIEMICKLADFYEVSIDCLLGRAGCQNVTDDESIITDEEEELLTAYQNSEMKEAVNKLLNITPKPKIKENSELKSGEQDVSGIFSKSSSKHRKRRPAYFSNIKRDLSNIVSAYKNPKQIKKPSVLCKDQRGLINYACSVLCFTLIHAFLLHFGCYSIALAVPVMNNTLSGLYHFSRSKRFKSIIWDILLILPHFIFGTILIVSQNESAILIAKIFEYLVTDLFVLYNALDDDMSKS